jgi:glycosyltransferase involved in cell wall biosynthesis
MPATRSRTPAITRVLIVPAWYPTKEQPFRGIFFREQAKLAAQEFDVRVLVVDHRLVGRRQPFRWLWRRLKGPAVEVVDRQMPGEQPPVHHLDALVPARSSCEHPSGPAAVIGHVVKHFEATNWWPDLIHAHCAIPGGIIACRLADRLRVPLVITEHQHITFDYFGEAGWRQAKEVYECAARVAAVSAFHRQLMLMNGVETDVVVTGNLVDERKFTLRRDGPRKRQILFVGFTYRMKDHGTFLRALQLLKDSGHEFAATMVCQEVEAGDGALLRERIAEYGVTDRIALHYEVSEQRMIELLHEAACLVSTSISETFGVSVCEALMCGCPVVATRSGGVDQTVRDGYNGYLVHIGDAQAIAARILDVFDGGLTTSAWEIRDSVLAKYGRRAFLTRTKQFYRIDASPEAAEYRGVTCLAAG